MDTKIINGIRSLAIDMINEAKCGHPGICLGAAPMILFFPITESV